MWEDENVGLLEEHLLKYPLMQIEDKIKLLMQSIMGPGHLISDKEIVRKNLINEYIADQEKKYQGIKKRQQLDVVEKLSMSVINLCASLFRPLFSLSCHSPHKVAKKLFTVMLLNGGVGLLFVGVMVVFNDTITDYFFQKASVDLVFVGQILMVNAVASCFLLITYALSNASYCSLVTFNTPNSSNSTLVSS